MKTVKNKKIEEIDLDREYLDREYLDFLRNKWLADISYYDSRLEEGILFNFLERENLLLKDSREEEEWLREEKRRRKQEEKQKKFFEEYKLLQTKCGLKVKDTVVVCRVKLMRENKDYCYLKDKYGMKYVANAITYEIPDAAADKRLFHIRNVTSTGIVILPKSDLVKQEMEISEHEEYKLPFWRLQLAHGVMILRGQRRSRRIVIK